jgi:elongator complex protein 3
MAVEPPQPQMTAQDWYRYIIGKIKAGEYTEQNDLHAVKKRMAEDLQLDSLPSNADILEHVTADEMDEVRGLLSRKPTRTISGVATIAAMWMWDDFSCPYSCAYCPQGEHEDTTAPKSYTGKEPSARRAIDNAYDPYDQVSARLDQLESIGHPTDKSEIIIMGGTFPSTPREFQKHFIKRCFDALNGEDAESLAEAHAINETAERRNVGLTIETRPDFAKTAHINDFLDFGCTRVEMGVQTLDDTVQEKTDRGHGTEEVVKSTKRLKDCGFKITYHMMLGLPGESRKQDIDKFRQLFDDPRFQPDELKIYPTAVIEGTKLYDMMEDGEYEPLDEEDVYDRLEEVMPNLPPYVRVKRVMRDIPSTEIDDGADRTNARQILNQRMEEKGLETREIRAREAGHVQLKDGETPDDVELVERTYDASQGTEHFLSFEDTDKDIILGYLRLRFPGFSEEKAGEEAAGPLRPEITDDTAIVRQLQVVGPAVPIGEDDEAIQHSGYGRQLVERAEAIARSNGFAKLAIISAVGTREYYGNLGYERDGPYMSKSL